MAEKKSVAETVTVTPADAGELDLTPPAVAPARPRKLVTLGTKSFPHAPVDLAAAGLGDIFQVVARLRELAKLFAGGVPSLDQAGDALKTVLLILGMDAEAEQANLFVDQLADKGLAIRDANGSEIKLRRLIADRFIGPQGGFTVQAAAGEPLPLHAGLSRLADELQAYGTGLKAAAAEGSTAAAGTTVDPTALPPIVWQIGGQILLRILTRLIGGWL